jgi:hypothetical protein
VVLSLPRGRPCRGGFLVSGSLWLIYGLAGAPHVRSVTVAEPAAFVHARFATRRWWGRGCGKRERDESEGVSEEGEIRVNRAPVLTLWAAIVAERLGHDPNLAITLGRAVAGSSARVKARAIGPEGYPRRTLYDRR